MQAIAAKDEEITELERQLKTADRLSHSMDVAAYAMGCDISSPEQASNLFRGTVSSDTHHWFARTAVLPQSCCQSL